MQTPTNTAKRIRLGFAVITLLSGMLTGCRSTPTEPSSPQSMGRYPDWWTPVPTNGAPAWEIFPQEAKPGEVILSKRNELGLLSNFAPTPFTFRGKRYASLEGF